MWPNKSHIFKLVVLLTAYLVTAKLCLSITAVNGFAALVWPPSGIALAALILYGYRLWPAVALGAFLINVAVGAPVLVAFGIALGNTLEATAGTYLLRKYVHFDFQIARLRDAIGLILVAPAAAFVSATIGVNSLLIGNTLEQEALVPTWVAWFTGDVLGILIFTSFLVVWLTQPFVRRSKGQLFEKAAILGITIILGIIIFWTPYTNIGSFPLTYLIFVPLMWAALRTGPRGTTLAILGLSLTALSAAAARQGVFAENYQQTLFSLQLFEGFIVLIFLPFAAIVEKGRNDTQILEDKNEQLRQALARLGIEDQAKNEFLAVLAHELRNPLSPVVSSLEILRGDAEENKPASIGVIDTAFAHVRTLTRLLDDLLDISRISRKKFKLNKEVIELQSVVEQSLQIVEAFYTSRKHNLSISMPQTPIWLEADPLRFQQIIVNILYNAAKYTEANGRIAFKVETEGKNELRISVKDNGIGIAPNMISRIFDPFVQAYAPGAGSGLGIGLALTKRLVELHGGKVWAESEGIGKGSTFTVVLPLATHLQLSIPIEKRGRKATAFKKKKPAQSKSILVADDNEAAATALGTLLTRIGHTVSVCIDGQTAIEKARDERPSVVILDIGMPDMDGYEVAKRLRHEHGDESMTLIAVTGFGQEEDKQKAEKAGFNYHLTKPVSIADLEAVLR